MGDYRRFQCIDADRLRSALACALALRQRHCLRPADRLSTESFAAEIECAFLNTYQARWQYAGESVAMASPRARRCCGGGRYWRRAEALRLWRRRSPRTPRRQRSSERKGSTPISSTDPSSSRSGSASARRLGPAAPLGAAEARHLPLLFRSGNPDDQPSHLDRRWVAAPVFGISLRHRRRVGGSVLLRRRGPPCFRRRLAAVVAKSRSLAYARRRSAVPVGGRLVGPQRHLARQCDGCGRRGVRGVRAAGAGLIRQIWDRLTGGAVKIPLH